MPEDRQAVGAVRRELQREQRVVERERFAQRGTRDQIVGSAQADPRASSSSAELLRRAQHAVRSTPRIGRALDRDAVRQRCAFERASGASMPAAAFGAPHTICQRLGIASVDRAHAQPIGVRMRRDAFDARRRRRSKAAAPAGSLSSTSRPAIVKRSHSARRVERRVRTSCAASVRRISSLRCRYANCRRKRRSFS